MIAYFRELLTTLKAIERHLSTLAACVKPGRLGDRGALQTRDYNDHGPI